MFTGGTGFLGFDPWPSGLFARVSRLSKPARRTRRRGSQSWAPCAKRWRKASPGLAGFFLGRGDEVQADFKHLVMQKCWVPQ